MDQRTLNESTKTPQNGGNEAGEHRFSAGIIAFTYANSANALVLMDKIRTARNSPFTPRPRIHATLSPHLLDPTDSYFASLRSAMTPETGIIATMRWMSRTGQSTVVIKVTDGQTV